MNIVNYVQIIKDYITSCELLDDYEIPKTLAVDFVSDTGIAISYNGCNLLESKCLVDGDVTIKSQLNFALYLSRDNIPDIERAYTTNFLANFEAWVQYQNVIGNKPIFYNNIETVQLWADNGSQLYLEETEDKTVYQVQIHIILKTTYKNGGNNE